MEQKGIGRRRRAGKAVEGGASDRCAVVRMDMWKNGSVTWGEGRKTV